MKNLAKEFKAMEQARQDSNAQALRASQEQARQAIEQARQARQAREQDMARQQARQALEQASQEYQREQARQALEQEQEQQQQALAASIALEFSMREQDRAAYKGQYGPLGHRRGSQGNHLDLLIKKFIDAKNKWPSAKELKDFAPGQGPEGQAWPLPISGIKGHDYALSRIEGHINHLMLAHQDLIPAHLRQALKASARQDKAS